MFKLDKCVLSVYISCMCALLIMEVLIVVFYTFKRTQIVDKIEIKLNNTVQLINKNNDTAAYREMETIQILFGCCGTLA